MKKNMRLKLVVPALLVLTSAVLPFGKKPDWVQKRPLSKLYFIGIGSSHKGQTHRDHAQRAKDKALNDLASQITVTISGESILQMVEKYDLIEEQLRSEIRSSTKANLEGYELVDTWEDEKEYWIYYRLSKALYYEQKQAKINRAMDLSLDMFEKARTSEQQKNISNALTLYLQSLLPLQNFIEEPLQTEFQGSKIFLLNEIYSAIHGLIDQIQLKSEPEKLTAKIGQPVKPPLTVHALLSSESQASPAVSNLPILFAFVKGAGEMLEKTQTNLSGQALCRITKITATDQIQIVRAEVDLFSLIDQESYPLIFQSFLRNLPVPSTKFMLNVSSLTVCLKASEKNLGNPMDVLYIEPAIKNLLGEYGFTFTEDESNADILIELKAESRRGAEMYGMYSAFVDFTISMIDMNSGKEVFKNGLQDIKGIQLNYQKAGFKAFENAAKEMSTNILPELIQHTQK